MHSNAEALQDGFTTAYRDRGEALLLDRVDDDVDPIELAVEVDDGSNQPVRHVSQDADVLLEDVIQIRVDQVRPVADRIDDRHSRRSAGASELGRSRKQKLPEGAGGRDASDGDVQRVRV